METKINNKETGMNLNNKEDSRLRGNDKKKKTIPADVILSEEQRNNLPPGSYKVENGELIPNDEATKKRFKKLSEK